jgi:hypothetical protein
MKKDSGTAAGAVNGSRLIDGFLARDKERRRREEEVHRAEQERERPFRELWDAACRLGQWRSDLTQVLGRHFTNEEAAERLASASSELRSVLQTHQFEDFLDFLPERTWSGPYAEDNREACEILHALLSEPADDSQAVWQTLIDDQGVVSRCVFNVVANDLTAWAPEYRRIAQLPESLTLDDLIGLLYMSSAGIGFLVRKRADVSEVQERFLKVFSPELSFCRDDLRRFANLCDQEQKLDTLPAKDITLTRLREYLDAWLEDQESGDGERSAGTGPGRPHPFDPFSVHPAVQAFASRCLAVANSETPSRVRDPMGLSRELATLREGMIMVFDAEDREVLREFRSIAGEVCSWTVRCCAPNASPRPGTTAAEAYDEFAKWFQEFRRFDFSKLRAKQLARSADETRDVAPTPPSTTTGRGAKGKNIEAQMLKALSDDPEVYKLSKRALAKRLRCSSGSIPPKVWARFLELRAVDAAHSAINRSREESSPKGRRKSHHRPSY